MRDLIGITYDAGSGGPELTAAEWRQADTALFVRDTNDLVVSGVRGGAVTNTGFSATVAPLTVVVQTTAALGAYIAAFPAGAAELAKTISAAHATLPRVDAIDVKIYDHEADASTFRGADIVYTAGTANASPVAPTFSGVGVRLGTFAVPASGGGNPVWTINPALIGYAGAGGILEVATDPSNPRPGTVTYNRTTKILKYWDGTAWQTLHGGPAPVVGSSSVNISSSSTTFVAGSTAFGVSFVAPPSGSVYITMSGYFQETQDGGVALMSYTVRTGGTVGSGTTVGTAANSNRALIAGGPVDAGQPIYFQGSRGPTLWTGLTPGATYNARVEIAADFAGGINVFYRELLVVPSL
jgi:hypothetical protein